MNPAPPAPSTPYPSFIICRAWAVFSVCKLGKGPELPDAASAVDPFEYGPPFPVKS